MNAKRKLIGVGGIGDWIFGVGMLYERNRGTPGNVAVNNSETYIPSRCLSITLRQILLAVETVNWKNVRLLFVSSVLY